MGSQARQAVVVGSGPNGLVAAITLARAGWKVTVIEAAEQAGGGLRSAELTLPGFVHDICAAVHPLAAASPAFESMKLEQYGLRWLHHEIVATHPLDGGAGATLYQDLERTASELDVDGGAYEHLLGRMIADWPFLADLLLGPLLRAVSPQVLVRKGWSSFRLASAVLRSVPLWTSPADRIASKFFGTPQTRALFAGCAAHSFMPLNCAGTAGFGALLLLLAHLNGWPIAAGGSQAIADALVTALLDAGGELVLSQRIASLSQLPRQATVLLDLTAANAAQVLRGELGKAEPWQNELSPMSKRLAKTPPGGACWKIDYALSAPLPWAHQNSHHASTVHLGGSLEEVAAAERSTTSGQLARFPFTLVAQPTLADSSRSPNQKHIAWVYAHVPYGYGADSGSSIFAPETTAAAEMATAAVERQLERFAPGFGDVVLARSVMGPVELQAHNANYVGGDITGGRLSLWGLLRRPRLGSNPYRLGQNSIGQSIFLCSASTPPGPGIHGMAGFHAARSVLESTPA